MKTLSEPHSGILPGSRRSLFNVLGIYVSGLPAERHYLVDIIADGVQLPVIFIESVVVHVIDVSVDDKVP